MSTRLIWSLGSAGVVLAAWAVALAISFYPSRRPQWRHRSAKRFADHAELPLPPEFADRLARRLRRRGTVTAMVTGPFFASWLAWYVYRYLLLPESEFKPRTGVPPMVPAMPVWAVVGLAATAAHFYDSIRESRSSNGTQAQNTRPRLADAIPPILTWAVRAIALLPLLAAVAWLLAPTSIQHGPDAVHPHTTLFAVAVIAAPLSVIVTEAVQKRILHGRTHTAAPHELAFEDAFRVQTVLAMLSVPAVFCAVTAALIAAPLQWARGWSGSFPVDMALSLAIFPAFGVSWAVTAKWVRRYYRRRPAQFSGWLPPATQPVGQVID